MGGASNGLFIIPTVNYVHIDGQRKLIILAWDISELAHSLLYTYRFVIYCVYIACCVHGKLTTQEWPEAS